MIRLTHTGNNRRAVNTNASSWTAAAFGGENFPGDIFASGAPFPDRRSPSRSLAEPPDARHTILSLYSTSSSFRSREIPASVRARRRRPRLDANGRPAVNVFDARTRRFSTTTAKTAMLAFRCVDGTRKTIRIGQQLYSGGGKRTTENSFGKSCRLLRHDRNTLRTRVGGLRFAF